MDKRQTVTVWVIGTLLGMELIGFILLAYFATFEYFITQFVQTIRFLSPVFLWMYVVAGTFIMIGRGQELTRATWISYVREALHFFLVSLLIAAAVMALCAFAAALLFSGCRAIADRPGFQAMMECLRQWVRTSFY
jgi:hypothetical protein